MNCQKPSGDFLSGIAGTFAAWTKQATESGRLPGEDTDSLIYACEAACVLVRAASNEAYNVHKRAMTAPDVLAFVGECFS